MLGKLSFYGFRDEVTVVPVPATAMQPGRESKDMEIP